MTGKLNKDRIEKLVNENLKGLTGDNATDSFKNLLNNQDADSIAYASLQMVAKAGGSGAQNALNRLTEFEKKYANNPEGLERVKSNAASIRAGADKGTTKALLSLGNRNVQNLAGEISTSQSLVSSGKFRTAYESGITALGDKIPILRGTEGGSGSDALDKLATQASEEDLKKLTPEARALLGRYKQSTGKQKEAIEKEFMALIAGNASLERGELVSRQSHEAGMDRIERDQNTLSSLSNKLSDKGEELPQKVFAEAVDIFADAAKTMKQVAEQQLLSSRDPTGRF